MRGRAWGISGRLIASYVVVTLAVVVLTEALVLGFQTGPLFENMLLQPRVAGTATAYAIQLSRSGKGVPAGSLLGVRGQPARPGHAQVATGGGKLVVPAIAGPIGSRRAVTAVVVIAADGTIIAGSAPARYPPGRPAAGLLPAGVATAIAPGQPLTAASAADIAAAGDGPTSYGSVDWALSAPSEYGRPGRVAYVYAQAPSPSGFVNPFRAWNELHEFSIGGVLLTASYLLLIAVIPVGVLFGLLASRRLVRRIRHLEAATLAVADGDYTIALPTSGRDEVGRLEANFTAMTRQLGSALAAERDRATGDARATERARIARELHDAISQHLFSLRMIAGGMRRASPENEQAVAIERITEETLRDMHALLLELRPATLNGAGLAPALREICATYRDRLGVTVDADLDDVTVPGPAGHALLRITQEACSNAVRHGNARRLAVSLARRDGQVELAVRDTGTGFDPAAAHTGTGLAHIRDRAAELGGTVTVDSAPGAGAAVTVRVPAP